MGPVNQKGREEYVFDLFGSTDERYEAIGKVFWENQKKETDWKIAFEKTIEKAKIKTCSDGMVLGYLFGRAYQSAETAMESAEKLGFLKNLLDKLTDNKKKGK